MYISTKYIYIYIYIYTYTYITYISLSLYRNSCRNPFSVPEPGAACSYLPYGGCGHLSEQTLVAINIRSAISRGLPSLILLLLLL